MAGSESDGSAEAWWKAPAIDVEAEFDGSDGWGAVDQVGDDLPFEELWDEQRPPAARRAWCGAAILPLLFICNLELFLFLFCLAGASLSRIEHLPPCFLRA